MSKKVAIMQPYFFPYIGYFQLINLVDTFILFDTPQFIRHGWIERNRVLKLSGEPMYIKVPLKKHHQKTKIIDIKIRNEVKWIDKIFAQLAHYKKHAPNYWQVIKLLNESLNIETDSIVELNYHTLKTICAYLDITTNIVIWSNQHIEIEPVSAPDEWALNICKAMNFNSYINPIGGISFFNKEKYIKNDIEIQFLESIPTPYLQFNNSFTPGLSIIDVLMFNSKNEIQKMLTSYSLT